MFLCRVGPQFSTVYTQNLIKETELLNLHHYKRIKYHLKCVTRAWRPYHDVLSVLYGLDVRSLAVASRSRQSETERKVADYSRIDTYRTCTSGKYFSVRALCAESHR